MSDQGEERDALGEALLRRQRGGQTEESRGFMDRQRNALQEQVAGAMKQMEQLRLRQDQLSREKAEVESLLRRQAEYLDAKHSLMAQLRNALAVLERREEETVRLLELVKEARMRFAEALERLDRIDEELWADKSFDSELTASAALVSEAKAMHDRLTAQIEASAWRGTPGEKRGPVPGMRPGDAEVLRAWFFRGLAFSAPVIVLALLAYLLIRLLT